MPEETDYHKERNRDRLEGDEMMTFTMFLLAGIAGGQSLQSATKTADAGIALLKSRFT